jgi:hypothetical protein
MKPKHKSLPPSGYSVGALTLDVVFPHTLDECARRLEVGSAQYYRRWQRAQVEDDGSFVVERLPDHPATIQPAIQFAGVLQTVEDGTRVIGSITPLTYRWLRDQRIRITALNGATLPLLVGTALIDLPLALLAVGYGSAMIGSAWWYRTHTCTLAPDLVQWVYAVLSIPDGISIMLANNPPK